MALQTALEEIVEMVRDECALSSATSKGVDHEAYIKRVIRRHHRMLADQYDWEHLKIKRGDAGKVMAAGQRYYDFPVTLNVQRPFRGWHLWSNTWTPLDYGITPEHYSIHDSDADVRVDPVRRWMYYGADQFEVWPIPASNGDEVRFEGQRDVTDLTADSKKADLDDYLLALFASATVLARSEQKVAASEKQEAAKTRLGQVRVGLSDSTRVAFGRGVVSGPGVVWPRHPTFIRHRG